MKTTLTLPKHHKTYSDSVFSNALRLIDTKIWEGVPPSNILGWKHSCEDNSSDYFFLATVLDSLIYRSKKQFLALLTSSLTSKLDLIQQDLDYSFIDSIQNRKIIGTHDFKAKLIPVIKTDDPPTKSGPLVLRHICRELNIDDKLTDWPQNVSKYAKSSDENIFIYVDDFTGTGNQLCSFFKSHNIDTNHGDHIYVCGTAHAKAISHIKKQHPNVKIIAGEILSENNDYFNITSSKFKLDPVHLKQYYDDFLNRNGYRINKEYRYGYDSQSLSFATYISTPNNSLPLFWYESDCFPSLLGR